MFDELFFGIDPLDYIYRTNSPPKQRELALHLFCNLNISAERSQQIFYESALLLPNELERLIDRVKADYQHQEKYPQILDDNELFAQFKWKLVEWIELNDLPNLNDLYRAFQILGFPDGSFDHLLNDEILIEYNFLDDDVLLMVLGRKRYLTKQQMGRFTELNRCILQNMPIH